MEHTAVLLEELWWIYSVSTLQVGQYEKPKSSFSILNRTTVRAFFLLLWCSFISGDYSLYEPSAKFNLPTSSLLFRGRQSLTEKYKRLRFYSSLAIRIFLRLKLVRKCIKSSFNASVFWHLLKEKNLLKIFYWSLFIKGGHLLASTAPFRGYTVRIF